MSRRGMLGDDLTDGGATRVRMGRAFGLRENVTAYDAVHVALAERLDCPLVIAD